ncbi:unnamed protein product [Schistocephalus solidus]|uniref:Uncharacterized protein n=1 Tax=Schistocephalus solidus TaxID=70667 RepID=A0A183S707_SCHSO|nr:unnamed protein product [Schistocephalus solidus]
MLKRVSDRTIERRVDHEFNEILRQIDEKVRKRYPLDASPSITGSSITDLDTVGTQSPTIFQASEGDVKDFSTAFPESASTPYVDEITVQLIFIGKQKVRRPLFGSPVYEVILDVFNAWNVDHRSNLQQLEEEFKNSFRKARDRLRKRYHGPINRHSHAGLCTNFSISCWLCAFRKQTAFKAPEQPGAPNNAVDAGQPAPEAGLTYLKGRFWDCLHSHDESASR